MMIITINAHLESVMTTACSTLRLDGSLTKQINGARTGHKRDKVNDNV